MVSASDSVALQDELVARCRALAAAGLVTAAAGNASVRTGEGVLLTSTGARFAELTREDLVLVDRAGQQLDGRARPSSELMLHLETYRRRPDVQAVVHSHGRHAVALSAVTDVVPALHYYCLELGGPVPVAAYRTFGTGELAQVTVDELGDRGGVVMAQHGSMTVGSDLASAASRAELLEWLCEVALLALAAGQPRTLSDADLASVRQHVERRRTT